MKIITKKSAGLLSMICLAAFIFLTGATSFTANPDFTGSWTLNESKSELGQFGARMAAKTMKVTGDATGIAISKAMTGMNGEAATMTEKITFDGKEAESEGMMGSKKKSTAKWSDDGQTLMVTSMTVFDMQGQKMEMKGAETWKMVDGMLQVSTTVSSDAFPAMTTKMVYEKAK